MFDEQLNIDTGYKINANANMYGKADNQPSTSSGKTGSLAFITRNGGLVLMRAGYQYTKEGKIKMDGPIGDV
ncbi:hypothetical protein HF086_012309 [Spodoptera exigua]|uniref:Uncharacterized protein n=1 Tax=Spodoptera exigua TaxID=7107 RepID=A0A922SM27_SPOEX|nr:hypothetical protein HF086_012309 [Spodoptera exigua]